MRTMLSFGAMRPMNPFRSGLFRSHVQIRTFSQVAQRPKRRVGRFLAGIVSGISIAAIGRTAIIDKEEGQTWQLVAMKTLPLRFLSRCWGAIHNVELPTFARAPLYNLWTIVFDCKLDEMEADSLQSFPNLASFFTRHLKEGVRPIDGTADIVSPADSKITVFGPITPDGRLEQIKGMDYQVSEFLGTKPAVSSPNSTLYYAVLYLAPGDYHRVHSAADWVIKQRRHFAGALFPVAPSIATYVPALFARNERIVLSGEWEHGYFSLSPVGAYNVGSMSLAIEPEVITNQSWQKEHHVVHVAPDGSKYNSVREYPSSSPISSSSPSSPSPLDSISGMRIKRGQELACFQLGSTVVLVWEVPEGYEFKFTVDHDQKVKVGQSLGHLLPITSSKI